MGETARDYLDMVAGAPAERMDPRALVEQTKRGAAIRASLGLAPPHMSEQFDGHTPD